MNRRQLLAGVLGTLVSAPLWSAPDPRLLDLQLEEQISKAQKLCVEAGETYQNWLNGRVSSHVARAEVGSRLQKLEAFQKKAAVLAVPASQTSVRHWARMQKQELQYFWSDMQKGSSAAQTQAQLQQRWQNAVGIQADLLETRRRQLKVVEKLRDNQQLGSYYHWRNSILIVMQSELALAQEVAEAFQQQNKSAMLTRRAISLYDQASLIQPPPSCLAAHQLYLERFTSLSKLCRSAQLAITAPDADTVANLQDDEEAYRKKALASDDASLAALRSLLSKTR
ncbi:MAG: hypothetical protein KF760_21240 [Candidatus Eremiobacteraeota bacterium]|nr:hypothetical protein [Candidatus Eremiobacteraeota bacterium]MCW5867278.1 hypothetical protein [Candidatus Eremiobacteraeota bacterium]